MTYIMAFHPDNIIRRNGKQDISLAVFKEANPSVPLIEGQFFQLDSDRLILMNEYGEGNEGDMEKFYELINSIKNPVAPKADKFYPATIPADAYLELDSMQASQLTDEGIPTGFKVKDGVQVWEYRSKTSQEIEIESSNMALEGIIRLESDITPRRLREAVLNTDNGWLVEQDKLISIERAKLKKGKI